MIRFPKYVIEDCPHCRRSGWRHKVNYHLLTEEEQIECFGPSGPCSVPKNLPENTERCYVGCGADIYGAVREAKEIATILNKKVSFEFNGKIVIVSSRSNEKNVVTKWWKQAHGKTPAQSWKDR
jgi:hypothetical protein